MNQTRRMTVKCRHCRTENTFFASSGSQTAGTIACVQCGKLIDIFPLDYFKDTGYFNEEFQEDETTFAGKGRTGKFSNLIRDPHLFYCSIMLAVTVALIAQLARLSQISLLTYLSLTLYMTGLSFIIMAFGYLRRRLITVMGVGLPLLWQVLLILALLSCRAPWQILLRQVGTGIVTGSALYLIWRRYPRNPVVPVILLVLLLATPGILWPLTMSNPLLASFFLLAAIVAFLYSLLMPGPYHAATCRFFGYLSIMGLIVYFLAGKDAGAGNRFMLGFIALGGLSSIAGSIEKNSIVGRFYAHLALWDCRFIMMSEKDALLKQKKDLLNKLPHMVYCHKKHMTNASDLYLWLMARSRRLNRQIQNLTRDFNRSYHRRSRSSKQQSTAPSNLHEGYSIPLCAHFAKHFSLECLFFHHRNKNNAHAATVAASDTGIKSDYINAIHRLVLLRDREPQWQQKVEQLKSIGEKSFDTTLHFLDRLQYLGMHAENLDLLHLFISHYADPDKQRILTQRLHRLEFAYSIRMGWGRDLPVTQLTDPQLKVSGQSRFRIVNNTADIGTPHGQATYRPGDSLQILLKAEQGVRYIYLEAGEGEILDDLPGQNHLIVYFNRMEMPYLTAGWRTLTNETPAHLCLEVPNGA